MRKMSRLQTWERAILSIAASEIIFSPNYLHQNLSTIYIDMSLKDATRAIETLLDLGYLEVSSESDPYFRGRTSYVCSASGYDYQQRVSENERLLRELIARMRT